MKPQRSTAVVQRGAICIVTGWKGTGTLGLRFDADARAFVARTWETIQIQLDDAIYMFWITPSFWNKCPEVRGAPIRSWLRAKRLAPWPDGKPPRIKLVYLGGNMFRAQAPSASSSVPDRPRTR